MPVDTPSLSPDLDISDYHSLLFTVEGLFHSKATLGMSLAAFKSAVLLFFFETSSHSNTTVLTSRKNGRLVIGIAAVVC